MNISNLREVIESIAESSQSLYPYIYWCDVSNVFRLDGFFSIEELQLLIDAAKLHMEKNTNEVSR